MVVAFRPHTLLPLDDRLYPYPATTYRQNSSTLFPIANWRPSPVTAIMTVCTGSNACSSANYLMMLLPCCNTRHCRHVDVSSPRHFDSLSHRTLAIFAQDVVECFYH